MNYLGLDYGEKKIGVALSAGIFSRPCKTIKKETIESQLTEIQKICQEEAIDQIIVGFPEQDKDSLTAEKINSFVKKLKATVQIPVSFQDETLSSQHALQKMIESGKGMKRRKDDDSFAAAIILQDYLDAQELK